MLRRIAIMSTSSHGQLWLDFFSRSKGSRERRLRESKGADFLQLSTILSAGEQKREKGRNQTSVGRGGRGRETERGTEKERKGQNNGYLNGFDRGLIEAPQVLLNRQFLPRAAVDPAGEGKGHQPQQAHNRRRSLKLLIPPHFLLPDPEKKNTAESLQEHSRCTAELRRQALTFLLGKKR